MNSTAIESLRGLRGLLVVDDDADTAALICEIIRRLCPEVRITWARGGVEAIEYLRRCAPHGAAPRPEAVLLDMEMPGMSGLEVLSALAREGGLRDIPVAIFTGLDDAALRRRALRAGACAFAVKPVAPERLTAVLGETLARCLAAGREPRP
ncbi:MAG: response regulator [Planctomycetota bacterium]|nr:response regulator [Planctomycetota bacterium]